MGILYYWTKECEQGIAELRYDRKALHATSKRFGTNCARIPTVVARGSWKTIDEPMLPVHKLRLEGVMSVSMK